MLFLGLPCAVVHDGEILSVRHDFQVRKQTFLMQVLVQLMEVVMGLEAMEGSKAMDAAF